MTTAEIEARVWSRIDDNPEAPATCSEPEVLAAINEGQELFALLTLGLERTVAVTLISGLTFFNFRALAQDFICPLQLRIGSAKVKPSTLSNLDALNSEWQSTPGTPSRYVALGFNLAAVTPQPVGDATATLTYAASPTPLVGDVFPEIPELYHPALVEYAVYRVRLKEGMQGLARAAKSFNSFLDSAREHGDFVRSRSRAADYDVMPFELALFDRARLMAKDKK